MNGGGPPDQGRPPPQDDSAPPARGSRPLAGGRCAPPPDDVPPQGGGQLREGEGRATLPPPASRELPQAGGDPTAFGASRREGCGSQAPPPANVHSEAGRKSAPPAAGQPQAGDAQQPPAECRPPAATVHPPLIPTLLPGAPGEASADTPAAGHDKPAGKDKPAGQDMPAGQDKPFCFSTEILFLQTESRATKRRETGKNRRAFDDGFGPDALWALMQHLAPVVRAQSFSEKSYLCCQVQNNFAILSLVENCYLFANCLRCRPWPTQTAHLRRRAPLSLPSRRRLLTSLSHFPPYLHSTAGGVARSASQTPAPARSTGSFHPPPSAVVWTPTRDSRDSVAEPSRRRAGTSVERLSRRPVLLARRDESRATLSPTRSADDWGCESSDSVADYRPPRLGSVATHSGGGDLLVGCCRARRGG